MNGLVETSETENRAFTEEEDSNFNELTKKVDNIDKTIAAKERAKSLAEKKHKAKDKKEDDELQPEERAFVDYIRGVISEERAKTSINMTFTDNGAVIPSSIINKIIEKVVDICPVYQLADKYNIGGTISIPYYDETNGSIEMAYSDEFTELTSKSGKFTSIQLTGYLAGALTVISKKLVNNSSFDVLNKVIDLMAKAITKFIEHECLIGTTGKCEGLTGVKQIVNASAQTALTTDELIDLQEEVPDIYQSDCIWVMNKKTRTSIRKLKDSEGNYILNKDATSKWGYTLFGNDVYTSDAMSVMAAGTKPIVYGDFSGLAVKVAEDASIEVLREKFATQHAIGVVAWLEIDTKVEDSQKLALLKMAE